MNKMDFIPGLPRTCGLHDSTCVVLDIMKKSTHFLPVRTTHSKEDYAKLYIQEMFRIHEVFVTIISDRGEQFIIQF